MDIRFVKDNVFDRPCDVQIYFTSNDLVSEASDRLIDRAGTEILRSLAKINGLSTGDCRILPAKALLSDYVIVSSIPQDLDSPVNRLFFKRSLHCIFSTIMDYGLESAAMDIDYIKGMYGNDYVRILNRMIQNSPGEYSDITLFLCQNTD